MYTWLLSKLIMVGFGKRNALHHCPWLPFFPSQCITLQTVTCVALWQFLFEILNFISFLIALLVFKWVVHFATFFNFRYWGVWKESMVRNELSVVLSKKCQTQTICTQLFVFHSCSYYTAQHCSTRAATHIFLDCFRFCWYLLHYVWQQRTSFLDSVHLVASKWLCLKK